MPSADHRSDRLRAFDQWVHAFAAEHGEAPDAAAGDVETLFGLAARMAADLIAWRNAMEALELARCVGLEPAEAGRALLECVFDDLLSPSAARLLATALELAWAGP